jgi:hypothetical protein
MIKNPFTMVAVALPITLAASFSNAAGSASNAWVSGNGTDIGACGPVTNPCRTLQYVHDNVVAAGGQIRVKDPAGYNAIIITKAISIINDGVGFAGISAPSGDAIVIQAGASDSVFIKGWSIDGAKTGKNGIKLISAGSLTIANCTIGGFGSAPGNFGITINPASGSVHFTISDTIVFGNGLDGIAIIPSLPNFATGSAASVSGTITRVESSGNGGDGINVDGSKTSGQVSVYVSEANASNNAVDGLFGQTAGLHITRSTITNNGKYGVEAGMPSNVFTYGDDLIKGNASASKSGPVNLGTLE